MKTKILNREHTKFLLGLFIVSCIARLLFFWVFTRHGENYLVHFDSAQYQNLAQNIVSGNGITNLDGTAQFYRLPGYSLFLAFCHKIFGQDYQYALLFQILLASLIPVLIFLLARVLTPTTIFVAKISSIIASVHVGFVLYAGMLATETLFTLFFLGFLLLFFKGLLQYSGNYFFLAGLLLGCASLIRPVGFFVVIIAIVTILLARGAPFETQSYDCSSGRAPVFLVLGWLSVVTWWLVRNYIISGFIFFHTLPGLHFLQYSATKIIIETEHCSYVQARKIVLSQWDDAIKQQEISISRPLHEYEKCVLGEKIAYTYMKKHPLYAIKNGMVEIFKTCCALYSAQIILSDTGVWPDYGPGVSFFAKIKRFLLPDVNHNYLIPIIYWDIMITILTILGFLGFMVLCIFDIRLLNIALRTVPFIGLMVFLTIAYGCARLRLPIEPLLLVLASYFWCFIVKTKILSGKLV